VAEAERLETSLCPIRDVRPLQHVGVRPCPTSPVRSDIIKAFNCRGWADLSDRSDLFKLGF
jgi:hypothetical protein